MDPTSSDDVPTATFENAVEGGPQNEGPADDWLGDENAIEWFSEGEEVEPGRGGGRIGRRVRAARGSGDPWAPAAGVSDVFLRRRLAGLAALVVLAGIVIAVPVVVFGGGGGTKNPVTTPLTTTAQTPTTAKKPTTTPKAPKTATTVTPGVVLPKSGKIQSGDTGAAVKKLQQALVQLGSTIKVDGDFGPATQQAVIAYQQANGLTADGIVGAQTAASINAALAQTGP